MLTKTAKTGSRLLLVLTALCVAASHAAADTPAASQLDGMVTTSAPQSGATKKITPNDVYAGLELLNRKLATLLTLSGQPTPDPDAIRPRESGLKPMHVYQIHLACIEQLRAYQLNASVSTMPLVVATPEKYSPAEVLQLTQLLLQAVDRNATDAGHPPLPSDLQTYQGKTPTDVFAVGVSALMKILALSGTNDISPNEVFSQTVRARFDAQAVVTTAAQAEADNVDTRRRLKAKAFGMSADGRHLTIDRTIKRKPADAFEECLRVRQAVNALRKRLDGATTPMPRYEPGEKIRPADVYLQTQLIIAELNLLKMLTGTAVTTPPTQPATGKTPNDVFAEMAWARYTLNGLLAHITDNPQAEVLRQVTAR